jgi:hypothetical protein
MRRSVLRIPPNDTWSFYHTRSQFGTVARAASGHAASGAEVREKFAPPDAGHGFLRGRPGSRRVLSVPSHLTHVSTSRVRQEPAAPRNLGHFRHRDYVADGSCVTSIAGPNGAACAEFDVLAMEFGPDLRMPKMKRDHWVRPWSAATGWPRRTAFALQEGAEEITRFSLDRVSQLRIGNASAKLIGFVSPGRHYVLLPG